MNAVPKNPKVYHLTHFENLQSILEIGKVLSDAERIRQAADNKNVGITEIKRRRLEDLSVICHPDTNVGDYVPFYLCPRSIMLFLIYKGNHPDLTYTGGQSSIIYLQADLNNIIEWATDHGRQWAFSDVNAGARYASFYCKKKDLDKIDWNAVHATDFRDPLIKDKKQAELLLYESFPLDLIETIGTINSHIANQVQQLISQSGNSFMLEVKPEWYF